MADIKYMLSEDVKTAMRSKDKARLAALRMIHAAFKQKEVDDRIKLNDQQSIAILDKMVKQHRDSIAQFKQAGRDDLVEKEQFELDIIETYLPARLPETEINDAVDAAIAETGAAGMKDMGRVMARLKEDLQARADMSMISNLVKSRLSR